MADSNALERSVFLNINLYVMKPLRRNLSGFIAFDAPSWGGNKPLLVFHKNTSNEGELYLKSMYVDNSKPTVDLGDVVMGYRIGQTLDGDPGTLKLTFPGGHQETNRVVEVVAMRTFDETGLFTPRPTERMNKFYSDGDWNSPIDPKTVAVVETDEPSVTIKGLDNHRWYAVQVKMDLPDGGKAVTSVNSLLAGRDASIRISAKWARMPGAVEGVIVIQATAEELAESSRRAAEANQ